MKAQATQQGYVLRLERGEELISALSVFAKEQKLSGAFIYGLGGASSVELGYYELAEKQYYFEVFNDVVEIVSLNGNVALKDGEPFWHVHGVFGRRDLSIVGGHIRSAVVAGTCEIFITSIEGELRRVHDDEIGLALLDCDGESNS